MNTNSSEQSRKPSVSIKVHKVSTAASKITGGAEGRIPESFGPSQPGTGMNWYS